MAREDSRPTEGAEAPEPSGRDRRRWTRANADWPISLATSDGRFEARVRDVSQAGVCFFIDREVPMMTVLAIDLELPVPGGKRLVKARGVVVRCERISRRIDHYEVAVFFNELAQPDRDALAVYVKGVVEAEGAGDPLAQRSAGE